MAGTGDNKRPDGLALAGDQPGEQAALYGGAAHPAGEQAGEQYGGEVHAGSFGVGQGPLTHG